MHVSTTRESQECGKNPEKSRYTVKRVPLTKNRWRAPFAACNDLTPKAVKKISKYIVQPLTSNWRLKLLRR